METMKMLLYCTKDRKNYLYQHFDKKFMLLKTKDESCWYNGKIVGECDFEVEEIETYKSWNNDEDFDIHYDTANLGYDDLLKKSCLNNNQLDDYLQGENGYAIHIKNLVIYDEPKELSDYSFINKFNAYQSVEKAPQNMMYVKQEKYYENNELKTIKDINKIIISIRPEWLCKILNGEKTIEVRRVVLKGMINNE